MKNSGSAAGIIQKALQLKEVRFIIVGGVNTLITYLIYVLMVYAGINHLVSMAAVYVIGIVTGYILNRRFTFESRQKPAGEFARYVLVYAAVFFIALGTLHVIVDRIGVNAYAGGAVNIAIVTVISWFGHKFFTFRNIRRN